MGNVKNVGAVFGDEEVEKRVIDYLRTSHFPVFRRLEVCVESGSLTVTGQLDTFYEKQVAMTACQNVAGVLELIDKIEVCRNESS